MPDPDVSDGVTLSTEPWRQPTRAGAVWHALKVGLHIARRALRNITSGPPRHLPGNAMTEAPVVAEHRSPLWSDGRADEFPLRCGKVQNLRVAVRNFDGIEVGSGQTVSFWSQVGRPSATRGFVVGREIINGCVVPTVGGGLCQLSNALASLANSAGVHLTERHRHTALIEAQGRDGEDATVAWNYVDLRFKADFGFRIEAELTSDELVVRIRAPNPTKRAEPVRTLPVPLRDERPTARGCLTCDQISCFRHKPRPRPSTGSTALLVNDRHPELARWIERLEVQPDWMVPWVRPRLRGRTWATPPGSSVVVARWPSWLRIVRQRLLRGEGAARQAERVKTAVGLARHYARHLRPDHTDLVVTQELLVPLWRSGALSGRTFNVYVHELPAAELQRRLDAAALQRPRAASLRDFRVSASWEQDEWRALARANTLLTAHHDVQRVLHAAGLRTVLLPWEEPAVRLPAISTKIGQLTVTLASSALARKGALEVALAARELGARVLILGSPPDDADAWEGVSWSAVGYYSDWLAQSDVVVLPAYVEHQPRALLRAIAAGIPVVASAACGLGCRVGVVEVPPGDTRALKEAIEQQARESRRAEA